MKILALLIAIAGISVLAMPRSADAQRAGAYSRMYGQNTVETIVGRVLSIDHIDHGRRGSYGEHLLLKTAEGRIVVHLGPSWFMDKQVLRISPRDEIKVTGSRIIIRGKPALIASIISKGRETLVLRDELGVPVWRGSGYR